MPRKLGYRQICILEYLVEFCGWQPGAGWSWTDESTTERIILSLVEHGFVKRIVTKPNWRGLDYAYRITPAGRAHLRKKAT